MKKDKIILILIFLFALFLRLYKLGSIPHTFHEDEVLSGYVGRYIIQNGCDLYGNKWPLWYFNKFGDYYIIGPIYFSGLATYLFGINEFATRFPHAFFGALAIFPLFYFTLEIFKNKKIALLSSLFLAIAPWHVVLSRSTTEGIIGATLFLTSLVFLLKSKENYSLKKLSISFLLSLSTYWIYHPFRIYAPLTFLAFLIIFLKKIKKNKKYFLWLTVFALLFLALTFYIGQTPWGKGRFMQTSIFGIISGVKIRLLELIADEGQNNILMARIFHNKIVGYGRELIKQYLSYFSPVFLLFNGLEKSRYYIPEQGMIYFSFFLLIIYSLTEIKNLISRYKKPVLFFLFVFFLSPFPASLTFIESPNPHRSLFLIIFLIILSAFGLYQIKKITFFKIKVFY
ncbi:MAG: glycosyltransferase family 39 protein, partial [Microgenomates group bacterium]|nr:glycosyltransferase family 39 protein [Microgenomates group bacterium]